VTDQIHDGHRGAVEAKLRRSDIERCREDGDAIVAARGGVWPVLVDHPRREAELRCAGDGIVQPRC
jgi:hypothetical protein